MRRQKIRFWILGLAIFTILLTSVYALLAANLEITGTATGAGDFKIEFVNATPSDLNKATATLSAEKTTLDISANLNFPSDSVTIDFVIRNTGSLNAMVENLVINNNSNEDFSIVINGLHDIEGTTLGVGEITEGSIVITWNPTSTSANPESVNFSVTIDYVQAT
ncbi:MAG: hypothetical protein GX247_04870 [Mollicutes bacterium]|nr:hypothetical protein [Mollicutes bacterium]